MNTIHHTEPSIEAIPAHVTTDGDPFVVERRHPTRTRSGESSAVRSPPGSREPSC